MVGMTRGAWRDDGGRCANSERPRMGAQGSDGASARSRPSYSEERPRHPGHGMIGLQIEIIERVF